jgi:XTP/dITP diphosphohydrolase
MELQQLAGIGSGIQIQSVLELGGMPPVKEDTGTFEGNAQKKARAIAGLKPADSWALADDSGLCVDALGGAPGVESAYYAGPASDPAANMSKLLVRMRGIPPSFRQAHFRCVLWLIDPAGKEASFEGRCDGLLLEAPTGGSGFGYDPIFVPAGYSVSFAQLDPAEKNRVSHRALAWNALVRSLAVRGG